MNITSSKYLRFNGTRSYLSPLILSGSLIASGIPFEKAYSLAFDVIASVPEKGIEKSDLVTLVAQKLPEEHRKRYITLEVVKRFLLSSKARGPLFIFLGGLAGKTIVGSYVTQQLGISQAIAIDNEKYRIATPGKDRAYLWKATYESISGYKKTVNELIPWMMKMVERNLFDYARYKKWCYFWEGIYLSPKAMKKLFTKYKNGYFFSVLILPKFRVVKQSYIARWQQELGIENLRIRRNIINRYLKNIKVIRSHIANNIDPIASFVIDSPILEDRLSAFYALLYQRLKDIADQEFNGWVERIVNNPTEIRAFEKYLRVVK